MPPLAWQSLKNYEPARKKQILATSNIRLLCNQDTTISSHMLKKRTCLETQLGNMMSGRCNMPSSFLLLFIRHITHYIENIHEDIDSLLFFIIAINSNSINSGNIELFLQMDTDSYVIPIYTCTQNHSISVHVYKLYSKHVQTSEFHFIIDKFCSAS